MHRRLDAATPLPPTDAAPADTDTRGIIGAVLAVVAWGSSGVVVKHIDMGALAIATYRFAAYGLGVVLYLRAKGRPLTLRIIRASALGGIALGLDVALFFEAVKRTTVVNATVIGATQPVFVMAVAYFLFGERIRLRNVALALVALAGVIVVVMVSSGTPEWNLAGDLAAIGAVFAWGAYFIFSKQSRGTLTPSEYTAGTAIWTVAINAPLAVAFGQDLSWPDRSNWVWLVVLTVGAGLFGHSVMNWSLQRIPLWLGSVMTLLIPVTGSALAWVALGEPLTTLQIIGMAVVLGALMLIVTDRERATTERARDVVSHE